MVNISVGWLKDERGLESSVAAAASAAEKSSSNPPRMQDSVARSQVTSSLIKF